MQTRNGLGKHLRAMHQTSLKTLEAEAGASFPCGCGRTFATLQGLRMHVTRAHAGVEPQAAQ
jgi:hypothetical protein